MAAKPRPVSLAQVVAPLYKTYDAEKHSLRSWNYYTAAAAAAAAVVNFLYYLPSQS
jgi:methyl coenzyme M reductase beta subunit